MDVTRPAAGATTGISIFMDSIINRTSSAETTSPTRASMETTKPLISARMVQVAIQLVLASSLSRFTTMPVAPLSHVPPVTLSRLSTNCSTLLVGVVGS